MPFAIPSRTVRTMRSCQRSIALWNFSLGAGWLSPARPQCPLSSFPSHLAVHSSSTLLYEKTLGLDRVFHLSNRCGVASLHDAQGLLDVCGLYPNHEAGCSAAYLD